MVVSVCLLRCYSANATVQHQTERKAGRSVSLFIRSSIVHRWLTVLRVRDPVSSTHTLPNPFSDLYAIIVEEHAVTGHPGGVGLPVLWLKTATLQFSRGHDAVFAGIVFQAFASICGLSAGPSNGS
jgi:hypothetical protein